MPTAAQSKKSSPLRAKHTRPTKTSVPASIAPTIAPASKHATVVHVPAAAVAAPAPVPVPAPAPAPDHTAMRAADSALHAWLLRLRMSCTPMEYRKNIREYPYAGGYLLTIKVKSTTSPSGYWYFKDINQFMTVDDLLRSTHSPCMQVGYAQWHGRNMWLLTPQHADELRAVGIEFDIDDMDVLRECCTLSDTATDVLTTVNRLKAALEFALADYKQLCPSLWTDGKFNEEYNKDKWRVTTHYVERLDAWKQLQMALSDAGTSKEWNL